MAEQTSHKHVNILWNELCTTQCALKICNYIVLLCTACKMKRLTLIECKLEHVRATAAVT